MAKIFVIAGHGAGDPGACGNGYSEAERVRVLAQRIKTLGGNNVILGNISRDYYADNGISTLNISKDIQIIELHMDAGVATARGGHVIINAGFPADNYDNALANMLAKILPGRANMIVGRNDLANPARAAAKGYGYRLVEFGFITNATDIGIFNSKMDEIARGVLSAFGIGSVKNETKTEKIEEEEDMREIVQAKSGKGQYYFDGYELHGFASPAEKKVIMDMYKRHTGKDLKTYVYPDADFDKLVKVLGRTGK